MDGAPAHSAAPARLCQPGRRVLVLQNPGRGSRNYIDGIVAALRRLGVQHYVLELQAIWNSSDPDELIRRLSGILVQQKIGAALGYGFNGLNDIPTDYSPLPTVRSFFEIRNIPHLMLWLDHPQWHADLVGLSPALQGAFRSANCVHFMKNAAHALEVERILGWPNCFELPPAVETAQFPVSGAAELRSEGPNGGGGRAGGECDLVAICSERGELPPWLKDFAALDDPDPAIIRQRILEQVRADLERLWSEEIPAGLRPEITALGIRWSALKAEHPFLAVARHWPALVDEFPGACWYLTLNYRTYMKAVRILWRLREWERRFYLAYLSRFFRVQVYGGDWSPLGLGPGGWVDFHKQSEIYARGRVALNITDGHDEEGLTLKPFEIAASGVPLLHYHAEGLERCFTPGRELEIFRTPREARQKLEALLDDGPRRRQMAAAALERVRTDHTWDRRVERMFELARLPMANFR